MQYIQINGINIEAEPDSGSDTNIVDECQFELLKQQAPETTRQPSNSKP
jgi:hypothetical protein